MNILITDGNSFISKNILDSFLSQKYKIYAPSKDELDFSDEKALKAWFSKNKIDVIIHNSYKSSFESSKDDKETFDNDTKIFFNIIDTISSKQKMIVLSSGKIYDINNIKPKVKEDFFGTHIPEDPDGYSKYICTEQMEFLDNVIELRLFGLYGKYDDCKSNLVANLLCKSVMDLPLEIKQNKKVDYLFVEDLMPVIDYFLQNEPRYFSYNVTPDESLDMLEIAEKIKKISAKSLDIKVKDEIIGKEYTGDNARIKSEISNIKFTGFNEGLKTLYNWYNDNKADIKL